MIPTCFSTTLFKRAALLAALSFGATVRAANPIITDVFTADPAAMVHDGKVYLYTGCDEATEKQHGYEMKKWLCFSSSDMVNWTAHGSPMAVTAFAWAKRDAWAGQVIERGGKFFWYAPVYHATIRGFAIGVAVSDSPTGPFVDARGSALITNDMTTDATIEWDDIDPSVFIDGDGQAYLFWGNTKCRYAKLKANMTELDGPIMNVDVPRYTEAPWIHKHKDLYYLSYATGFPERMAYATSTSIHGPWVYRGLICELAGNCNTNHQAIIEFKGRSYLIYHNGGLLTGGSFRRSACVDYLDYNDDGTIKFVVQTGTGVEAAK